MTIKIKKSVYILALVAMLFHPTVAIIALDIPLMDYLYALIINISLFAICFGIFYFAWMIPFMFAKSDNKNAFRSMVGLMGCIALYLGVPCSALLSLYSITCLK
jgi:hypothetical protein